MESTKTLLAEVAAACREHALLAPGDRVLVAVSAGADSTALAWILGHLGAEGLPLDLVLGHVDHGWRGRDEAKRDAACVRALAQRLGVPVEVGPPPPEPVPSEDAARRWRYTTLRRMAEARGARKLATGHHLRDQAETVLMRLERRSGRIGLRGIPRRRPLGPRGCVEVVRPLLDVEPARLRDLLEGIDLAWREDATNAAVAGDRLRARRHLEALEARGAAATRRLAAFASRVDARLRRREAALAARLEGATLHLPWAGAVAAPRPDLADLSTADLDLALRRLGAIAGADREGPFFTRRHVALVRSLLGRGGALDLPRGARLRVAGRRVWLCAPPAEAGRPRPRLARVDTDAAAFELPAFLADAEALGAALDADRLGPDTRLRPVRPGDRFVPWSRHATRETSVASFLARQGVPADLREAQLVVEARGAVAWLVGWRVSAPFAVTPATRRVARLQVVCD